MNNVYFGCTNCKTYVDAGYRWAYWQLDKPGVVAQGEVANIDRLLSTDSYWRPQGWSHTLPRLRGGLGGTSCDQFDWSLDVSSRRFYYQPAESRLV